MNKYLQWIYLDKSILKKIHLIASFLLFGLQRIKSGHQIAVVRNMVGA